MKGINNMIRKAKVEDGDRIAGIEVESSRYAYKDILSEDFLYRDLTVESRTPVHKYWISENRFEEYVYEDQDTGVIKGMMGIGMCEDEDKKDVFELHFLYIDPDFLRIGTGSEMLQFFEREGRARGYSEFVIWVLEDNDMGKNFYAKNGYVPDGKEKIFKRWNKREIRYVKG